MRFRLYREYGALNSPPVFDAIEYGLRQQGHDIVTDNEDVAVIWSVLWSGRMRQNKLIYDRCQQQGKPILIIEALWKKHNSKIFVEGGVRIDNAIAKPLYDSGWACTSLQGIFHVWEHYR